MPRINVVIGAREQLEVSVHRGSSTGLFPTEGQVRVGQLLIRGTAEALRNLAAACQEAAVKAASVRLDQEEVTPSDSPS